jgi:hypothetical protein
MQPQGGAGGSGSGSGSGSQLTPACLHAALYVFLSPQVPRVRQRCLLQRHQG